MQVDVTEAPDRRRFEARVDGELAAIAEYIRTPELVVLTHTEVLPGFAGRGIPSELVRRALDSIRGEQMRVLPLCPFVAAWMGRHAAEYGDLEYRSRTTITPDTA
ncbi:GNAT family N-acetyltransferase [Blastococcus sp. SYSU D00695]